MSVAWGDESVRTTNVPSPMYLMGACIGKLDETSIRTLLGRIKPSHARKLHWRDLLPKARAQSIDSIETLTLSHVIVAAVPLKQWNTPERARRKCLEALLPILEQEYGVDIFTLESRDKAQDTKDIRFIDALRGKHFIDSIRIDLIPGAVDSRLWIPDQLLGAYGDAQTGDHQYDGFLNKVRCISISEL